MCFSDYDPPDACTTKMRKARKPHKCCECNREIQRGEQYEYVSGIWDGRPETFKTCAGCLELRARITAIELSEGCHINESVPPFGGLLEFAPEYGLETQ